MMSRTIPLIGLCALCLGTPPHTAGTAPPQSLVGISVPSRIATIAPEQAGKLVTMPVHDGDRVAAGDVLFALSSTLEQLEVDRLRALADSDLAARRARATLAYAEQQAKRERDLRDQEISSERDLQAQEHEFELARLRVEQAELDHAQARNALRQAEERLAQRTVESPFDGVVTHRFKSVGEAVEKFVPVVEVMTLDPLWIEFECPVTDKHLFREGGTVAVAPAVQPDDVRTATITYVSPKATAASHSFMVRAAVPNPDRSWQTGLKMTVEPDTTQAAPPRGK
ncbi:MAG: efflux RND transporter periplasmic adaptor subunit [Planctomycetota bacterium]